MIFIEQNVSPTTSGTLFQFKISCRELFLGFLQERADRKTESSYGGLSDSSVTYCLEFAGEMEANVFKVVLCHLQYITGVSEEYVAPFAIFSHVLIFALLEVF